ncbi:SDR family NAD(P)-dependent oxidoreductase [Roseibium aggregatum]|uniref:SDR family NAD(P)-dependent oxidoreductase n=1 Tax=Roseibium aggregatum TaxID=187304 RepID=UPI0025AC238A|nr:SDR family oxidoreductase [Roseibium aggregatum]WJS05620.1 SDR family oxidoreductase [Roseibium aggregatum]
MNSLLAGKRIIVTGGGAGIGLGIVRQCLAAGAEVIALECDPLKEEAITAEGAIFREVDVADAAGLRGAIIAAGGEPGSIQGLVNNAGITIQKPLADLSLEEMDLLWMVNQRSVLVAAQAVAPILAANGSGAIVNIASNHARASDKGYEAYAGTKGAVVAMTRALAWSLGPSHIRVNALAPGLTMTETVAQAARDPGRETEFRSWHATGEVNTVDDVGRMAAFLLSEAARSVTGAEIIADQGMSARLGAI